MAIELQILSKFRALSDDDEGNVEEKNDIDDPEEVDGEGDDDADDDDGEDIPIE